MANCEGVFIPVTTPFRGDEVAPERLAANIRRWNATALAGYVVLGSTGEFKNSSGNMPRGHQGSARHGGASLGGRR